MNLKPTLWLNILLIFYHHQQNAVVNAALHAFLIEDSAIFRDCKNEKGYLGVADFFDLTNFKVEIYDERVHLEGSITMVWDVSPDDRVEVKSDVFKYYRGSWQPTVYTLVNSDFCSTLYQEDDIWYKSWARFINKDDMKCVNNKGHTFHHESFDMELLIDAQGENSGLHKIVIKLNAYNEKNEKQPNSVCLEIVGEIVKK